MLPSGGSASHDTSECQKFTRDRALACLELIKTSGRSRVSVDLHYCGIAFWRGSDRMNMEFTEAAT